MDYEITTTPVCVCRTPHYELFKTMEGNRWIAKARARKIKRSLMANGYIHNPIIVNEKMEIVDGQARFEALKEMKLPVEFIKFEGLTIKECIALNVYQTSWSLQDYIESYAARGNQSYRFLQALFSEFRELGLSTCICACTGRISETGNNSKLKNGEFECTGEQYERAGELLAYVMKFYRVVQTFKKGANNYIYHALMFAYQVQGVDREKLVDKFNKYYGMDVIPKFNDARGALQVLTKVYNTKSKDKIWFEVEYEQAMTKKYPWYAKRYGAGGDAQ